MMYITWYIPDDMIMIQSRSRFVITPPDRFPSHTRWRHQMETFSALLAICAGNSPVPGELPAQRPVTRSFDVYFDLRPNKRLSKQSWGWWFETLSCTLWRHRNDTWENGEVPGCYSTLLASSPNESSWYLVFAKWNTPYKKYCFVI